MTSRTSQKIIFIVLAIFLAAGLIWHSFFHQISHGLLAKNPASVNAADQPDYTQIDNQGSGQVTAQYLPNDSSSSQAVVKIDITGAGDLSSWDYAKKIIWANSDIDPLPTISSKRLNIAKDKLSVQMIFQKDRSSHYHLIVKDIGGIQNRVLHFYNIGSQ